MLQDYNPSGKVEYGNPEPATCPAAAYFPLFKHDGNFYI